MDGTMIGNIGPSACEYEIIKALEPKKLPAFKKQLTLRLRYGPLRPHLDAFCKAAAAAGARVFVFTASDDRWARIIIPCIERCIGFQFERPLFTRSNCHVTADGEYKKSIDGIVRIMHRRLQRSPHAAFAAMTAAQLKDRTVLIDNNPHVLHNFASDRGRMLLCPTYNYVYTYDVLSSLAVDVLHAKFHKAAAVLKKHGMLRPDVDVAGQTYQQFMQAYYARLSSTLQETYAANLAALKNDRFWLTAIERLLPPQTKHVPLTR